MPHINAFIPVIKTEDQEKLLVKRLGELITIVPNKTEASLMITVNSSNLYYGGKINSNGAYIEVKVYTDCSRESKELFTNAVLDMLVDEFSLDKDNIYMNFFELFNWAAKGKLL